MIIFKLKKKKRWKKLKKDRNREYLPTYLL